MFFDQVNIFFTLVELFMSFLGWLTIKKNQMHLHKFPFFMTGQWKCDDICNDFLMQVLIGCRGVLAVMKRQHHSDIQLTNFFFA